MSERHLHLACYDVADRRRLAAALKLVRGYATGGQKSVHEVFLTDAERLVLVARMKALLSLDEDRFLLLRLDPRCRVLTLGRAAPPSDLGCIYIG